MNSSVQTELRPSFPKLGYGVGLRTVHFSHLLEHLPKSIDWFEAISENFMGLKEGSGGKPIHVLETLRQHYPIVLHGVSLSIGSTDPLDKSYLKRLKALVKRVEPAWISDHLCWTGVQRENLHDLLPLPFTEEALEHVVSRVGQVQDFLKRPILLENVSSYITFRHSQMTEWDFLTEICHRSGCGLLLDINNIYVSSVNHGFDAEEFLYAIPRERVHQFHLAGHLNKGTHLIDTHDHPVCDPVWELYRKAKEHFGDVSTLLERDDHIPPLEELVVELDRARAIGEEVRESQRKHSPQSSRASRVAPLDLH